MTASLAGKLGSFVFGNALVQTLNMLTGLAILWLLPVEQYALYITSAALIAMGSVGSDSGISQALLTLGSRMRGERKQVSVVFETCWRLRRQVALWISLLVTFAVLIIGVGQQWSLQMGMALWGLVICTNWAQTRIAPYNSLFNIYQDSQAIFSMTVWPAVVRLFLTIFVCQRWSLAVVALGTNLIGFVLQDLLASRRSGNYVEATAIMDTQIREDVIRFVKPLIPGVIYYVFQGQIAVFMLTWAGQTSSIAEVGALGRLQQVFVFLGALNGFLVQPYFAQITDRRLFQLRAKRLLFLSSGVGILIVMSSVVFDSYWVMILGSSYNHLKPLIPFAVGGSLITVFGATIYTVVIATQFTRMQWLQIPMGLGVQALVLVLVGVSSTRDALLLTYAPAASYLLLQLGLLSLAVRKIEPMR